MKRFNENLYDISDLGKNSEPIDLDALLDEIMETNKSLLLEDFKIEDIDINDIVEHSDYIDDISELGKNNEPIDLDALIDDIMETNKFLLLEDNYKIEDIDINDIVEHSDNLDYY